MNGDRIRFEAATVDGVPYLSDAVPLVGWDEGDDEWLRLRRAGIGASEIASVCAVPGAFSSPYALYWAKTLAWENDRTFAMRVGQALEAPIAELFAEEHPEFRLVRPAARLFGSVEHRWMLASPDYVAVVTCDVCRGTGRAVDMEGVNIGDGWCGTCAGAGAWLEPVECKSDEGKSWGDTPPLKHVMQVWQQMMVLGAPRGHLVRLSGKRLSAYIVEPDPAAWEQMIVAGDWFMACRRDSAPPDVDGTDATADALRRLFPAPLPDDNPWRNVEVSEDLLAQYRTAWENRQRALDEFAHVQNRMRLTMGEARYAVDTAGNRWVERRQYKRAGYVVGPMEIDEIRKAW